MLPMQATPWRHRDPLLLREMTPAARPIAYARCQPCPRENRPGAGYRQGGYRHDERSAAAATIGCYGVYVVGWCVVNCPERPPTRPQSKADCLSIPLRDFFTPPAPICLPAP